MESYRYTDTFPRLRAIWAILRDGAVIWNVNLDTATASFFTRAGKVAPGIVVLHGLTVDDLPLTLDNLSPILIQGQDDDTSIGADEDIETR